MHQCLSFTEIGETASKLQSRIEEVKIKRKADDKRARVGNQSSPSKKRHMAHDLGKSSFLYHNHMKL